MPQQLTDDVDGQVGRAGQRQDRVRAAGREQRRGHPERVRHHHVVVGQPVNKQQRPGQAGGLGDGGGPGVSVRVLLRQAEEPLPPVRVVEPLIVRRGPGNGRVEHVGAAEHGDGRERAAIGPAVDTDPRPVQVGERRAERVERVHLIVKRRRQGVAEHRLRPLRPAARSAAPVGHQDGEAVLGEPLVLAERGSARADHALHGRAAVRAQQHGKPRSRPVPRRQQQGRAQLARTEG